MSDLDEQELRATRILNGVDKKSKQMNIEEAIDKVDRFVDTITVILPKYSTAIPECCIDEESWIAIKKVLTAYEKEKEKNKKIENELKDITKKYMEAESVKFWYNYIHKDKIRKMLQELEDRRNKQPIIGYWSKKAMLEKLLKEE